MIISGIEVATTHQRRVRPSAVAHLWKMAPMAKVEMCAVFNNLIIRFRHCFCEIWPRNLYFETRYIRLYLL